MLHRIGRTRASPIHKLTTLEDKWSRSVLAGRRGGLTKRVLWGGGRGWVAGSLSRPKLDNVGRGGAHAQANPCFRDSGRSCVCFVASDDAEQPPSRQTASTRNASRCTATDDSRRAEHGCTPEPRRRAASCPSHRRGSTRSR